MTKGKLFSKIAINYPSYQEINGVKLNAYKWLQSRQKDDNAEGFWRVYDTLYDLTDFINLHPGGVDWIKLTKGTDITEAFEIHHFNRLKVELLLQKYRIRETKLPRNFKFTFKETGFYRTLQRRIVEELKRIDPKQDTFLSKVYIDVLFVATLLTSIFSVKFDSIYFMLLSGLCMCYTIIAAHNFFHRRDNFRMYYFNLSFFSFKEWRISHAMSHHLYPNSLHDMEMALFDPFLCWFPNATMKGFTQRYLSWIYSPVIYTFLCVDQLVKRFAFSCASKTNLFERCDLVPLVIPVAMLMFGNLNLVIVIKIWMQIILVNSFIFGLIGLNAGHHHPNRLHDGDKVRDDLDWGIYSLDTVMDNTDLRKTHFLALTHFGHHALHHLFPTIDHGILPKFYPVLFETMKEFEVELDAYPWYHHVYGQFQQLARIQPNPIDSLEKYRNHSRRNKTE